MEVMDSIGKYVVKLSSFINVNSIGMTEEMTIMIAEKPLIKIVHHRLK
jgi:hypothetical protein